MCDVSLLFLLWTWIKGASIFCDQDLNRLSVYITRSLLYKPVPFVLNGLFNAKRWGRIGQSQILIELWAKGWWWCWWCVSKRYFFVYTLKHRYVLSRWCSPILSWTAIAPPTPPFCSLNRQPLKSTTTCSNNWIGLANYESVYGCATRIWQSI